MVNIGRYNTLTVVKTVEFGVYLDGGQSGVILLPSRYVDRPLHKGDEIEVFVYRDNDNRLIATTLHPYAQVGEFAFLQVMEVNRIGAFLDWGLMKQLLVPYSEQNVKLSRGMVIPVYVYLDDASQRIVASAKLEHFLGNAYPDYNVGDSVDALIYKHTDNGYRAIVDNKFYGLFYERDLYSPLVIGTTVKAYVRKVRDDGKIDLLMQGANDGRVDRLAEVIKTRLHSEPDGFIPLCDSSSPEAIRETFNCSKRDFKKAIGFLYRQQIIQITPGGVRLNR